MRNIIETFEGTDDELLSVLNERTIKKVNGDGMVTLAMVADVSLELAAQVTLILQSTLDAMPSEEPQQQAQKLVLQKFFDRFTVSDRGLDFANLQVRATLSQVLAAGLSAEQIEEVLSIGAFYVSIAEETLGRDATIEDVEAERQIIAREELQQRWQELFLSVIQPALQAGTEQEIVEAIGQVAEEF
jgi:alkylhydroperoxidase/carboxymuconolactone decarboxylase family protein YurZ